MIYQTIKLLTDDVLEFHEKLTQEYGNLTGIRDYGLLELSIAAPFQSAFEQEAYETIFDKAAKLAVGIIKNHPFIDGNKRTGIHAMFVLLYINNILLNLSQKDIENLAIDIADNKIDEKELSKKLKSHANINHTSNLLVKFEIEP